MDAEQLYNKLHVNLQSKLLAKPTIRIAGLAIGGAWIAERLASDLGLPQYGVINVAFHRDDYAEKGLAAMRSAEGKATHLPFVKGQARVRSAEGNDVANAQLNPSGNGHERMLVHHLGDLAGADVIR